MCKFVYITNFLLLEDDDDNVSVCLSMSTHTQRSFMRKKKVNINENFDINEAPTLYPLINGSWLSRLLYNIKYDTTN